MFQTPMVMGFNTCHRPLGHCHLSFLHVNRHTRSHVVMRCCFCENRRTDLDLGWEEAGENGSADSPTQRHGRVLARMQRPIFQQLPLLLDALMYPLPSFVACTHNEHHARTREHPEAGSTVLHACTCRYSPRVMRCMVSWSLKAGKSIMGYLR